MIALTSLAVIGLCLAASIFAALLIHKRKIY